MQSAVSVTAETDPPSNRGETSVQTSLPSQASPPAGVPSTDGVLTRSEAAASRPSRSATPAEDSQSDAVERAQFAQRVARAFTAAADRGGAIRLRLHPPELGSLRLELTVRNGAMTARLETETESARTMLLENLPALKERLAGHQIKVDRFDVDWQAQSQGNLPQGSGEHSRWQPPAAGPLPGTEASSRRDPSAESLPRTPARPNAETSFDVVI
jgi:flagellar hook-length control protein FliK